MLTVEGDSERDESVERLEDDGRLDHAVVVQLSQVLHCAHPPLVELGMVDLQKRPLNRSRFSGGNNSSSAIHLNWVW